MKKQIVYLSILVLLTSCKKDFTLLSPVSQRNVQNFYKTESHFRVAVNGVYDALQLNGTYGRTYILLNEMRSDNTANGGGATGLAATLEAIDQFKEIATATELQNAWSDSYWGIARCNAILDRIDAATFDQKLKDQFKGESLFIRSLLYYNLAISFGNIPLQLKEISAPEAIDLKQVPALAVYAQIISDLKQAEALIPANYTGADIGRVTSGAVSSFLGKVYLAAGNKAEAATVLRKVVTSQRYQLVADYARLWGAANENNIESIFEIQYRSGGQGEGSGYMEYFAPQLGRSGGVGGGNTPLAVTADMFNAYEPGDDRFLKSIFTNRNTGRPDTTYVRKYLSTQLAPFDADNNWVVLRYADVLLMLAEAIGESTEAYSLINTVRNRARLGPISASTPRTFNEKLLRERRVEFAFENQRWQDLLRFGVAKSVMSVHLNQPQTQIKLLYPIPQRELDVSNGKLQQNPEHK